ncbi:uncharacterized protein LOC144292091 isoform X3 [Canis aureus]
MIQEHVGPRPHSQEPGFLRTLWRTLEAPLGATSTSEGTTQNHRTVVPKIANPRNHQEADTDANTRGLIYTLELGSKYTRHSGAGTWTPRRSCPRLRIRETTKKPTTKQTHEG